MEVGNSSSRDFISFLRNNGIGRRVSCPHTPQQNGIAERKHRHIVESAMSMLHDSNLPINLWTEAFHSAVHVINRLPMVVLENKSPYHCLFGAHPSYHDLRVFGCVCYVHIDRSLRNKFQDKAQKCRFVGYADDYKGYRCYDPTNKRIRISRNVVFDEQNFDDRADATNIPTEVYYPWLSSELFAGSNEACSSDCVQQEEEMSENTETSGSQNSEKIPGRYKGIVYSRQRPTTSSHSDHALSQQSDPFSHS